MNWCTRGAVKLASNSLPRKGSDVQLEVLAPLYDGAVLEALRLAMNDPSLCRVGNG